MSHNASRLSFHSQHGGRALKLALSLAASLLAASAQGHAQIRINGLVGVAHLTARSGNAPASVATARLEATVSLIPWLGVGGYLGAQSDLNGATGGSYGLIAAFRPHIPTSPIDPMMFASVGRLRYPAGGGYLSSGWDSQLGLGLALHASSMVDIEGRVAYMSVFSNDDDSALVGPSGYALSLGMSLRF